MNAMAYKLMFLLVFCSVTDRAISEVRESLEVLLESEIERAFRFSKGSIETALEREFSSYQEPGIDSNYAFAPDKALDALFARAPEGSGGAEPRLPRGAGIESTWYTIHRESRLNCPSCALSISTSRPFSRSRSTRTGFSSAGRTLVY